MNIIFFNICFQDRVSLCNLGPHFVDHTDLESQQSDYLCLLSAGVEGAGCYIDLILFFSKRIK